MRFKQWLFRKRTFSSVHEENRAIVEDLGVAVAMMVDVVTAFVLAIAVTRAFFCVCKEQEEREEEVFCAFVLWIGTLLISERGRKWRVVYYDRVMHVYASIATAQLLCMASSMVYEPLAPWLGTVNFVLCLLHYTFVATVMCGIVHYWRWLFHARKFSSAKEERRASIADGELAVRMTREVTTISFVGLLMAWLQLGAVEHVLGCVVCVGSLLTAANGRMFRLVRYDRVAQMAASFVATNVLCEVLALVYQPFAMSLGIVNVTLFVFQLVLLHVVSVCLAYWVPDASDYP